MLFDQSIKLSGNLYRDGKKLLLRVKGAPKPSSRCDLGQKERDAADAKLIELANKGYKVIAIACAETDREINELGRLDKHSVFKFEGLIAVADALRKEAPAAIPKAARMGVKPKWSLAITPVPPTLSVANSASLTIFFAKF